MMKTLLLSAAVLAFGAGGALAQQAGATAAVDPVLVEAFLKDTFAKAPPEWIERMKIDETLASCNRHRNNPPSPEADAILKREQVRLVFPADGKLLGDWKAGHKIADSGFGGRFNDGPNVINGGNCYACHQLDKKELSFGTLGPSLTNYGKDRKYDPEEIKRAYAKVYNSQSAVACSNMPRFGVNKFLSEQQIKDVIAYLFDPESPVNK